MAWLSSLVALASGRALLPGTPAAESDNPRRRLVDVGWLVDTDHAGFIWDAPARLRAGASGGSQHAKSVSACPAVVDLEARHFVVPCPITARLRMTIDRQTGEAQVANVMGDRSPIRSKAMGEMVKRVAAREWRSPGRPIIQIVTPYLFLSDAPVYMTQLPPFGHHPEQRRPGLMIGGRFPIDVWPRHLMWAFEWHDLDQELVLRRGEPWFYVSFETNDPSSHVRLVEAERTEALVRYMQGVRSVSNYVGQTFSLFRTARTRRPKTLLQRARR